MYPLILRMSEFVRYLVFLELLEDGKLEGYGIFDEMWKYLENCVTWNFAEIFWKIYLLFAMIVSIFAVRKVTFTFCNLLTLN